MTESPKFETGPVDPGQINPARLDANWRAITIELDAPRPSRLERVLRVLRVPQPAIRMVAATPALRRAWYVAIAAVVLVGLGVAEPADDASRFALLVLAPLLPVLGVAMAYGTAADPAHEIQVATPTHGLRLVAVRAAVVLAVAIVVIVAPSLLSDGARPYAAAWLLPALAVTGASLAAMTWRPPRQATSIIAVAWLVVVVVARVAADDPLAAFRSVGQSVSFAVAAIATGLAVARRDRFEHLDLRA